MNYVNVVTGQPSNSGTKTLFFLRLSPINPYEARDAEGNFPSGTIDSFHALRVNFLLSAGAGESLAESTRIEALSVVTISNVEYTRVDITKPLQTNVGIGTPFVAYAETNLGRDVKVGYDKFPVPSISAEVPLFDIVTGERLVDESGNILITETNRPVAAAARARNATPAIIDPITSRPVRVVEEFPEFSETSSTLLGIERAEVQLSLFSDVSVLGFDDNDWEVFTFRRPGRQRIAWDNRRTRDFGNHYDARMIEVTEEQAIQIGAFPVPYVFPFGPRFADQGRFQENVYPQFLNFIELGNILYTYFSESGRIAEFGLDDRGREFRENFLDPQKVTLDGDDVIFIGMSEAQGLELIDTWTRTWVDILDNSFRDPRSPTALINVPFINTITGNNPPFDQTRPGYESAWQRYGYMQSKKAYRYQPGRISGFTFGARASADSGSNANSIEWGISNPTDEYVFQVRGAEFNIVRRSTVPLDPQVLRDQGLDPLTNQQFIPKGDPFDIDPETGQLRNYFTTVIGRDFFNGDPLNGSGRSGYLLTLDKVTMYKIEFGWYGAIGAKFYAYVPVDNGEARWVLIHTLVIENKLGEPCLGDPYFRFKYSINIEEAARVKTPQFIYKYGASCYIDGGDEGTVVQRSYSSGERNINATNKKSIIGVYPKTNIVNDQGVSKPNKKIILPKSASVTSTELAHVEIFRCNACPGFGHNFNHGLVASQTGRVVNLKFVNSLRNVIEITNEGEYFTEADVGSKLIADGLWSGYIRDVDRETETEPGSGLFEQALIERMVFPAYFKQAGLGYPDRVVSLTTGQLITIPVNEEYPYPVRLTNYDAIAGSTTPMTGSKIEIQFLNPSIRESQAHFADYLLGVTDRKPVEFFDTGGDPNLGWDYGEIDPRPDLPFEDILFAEVTQSTSRRDRLGFENGEANYPRHLVGEIDYRIPQPPGPDSGVCSKFTVELLERQIFTGTLVQNNPETGDVDGQFYLTLTNTPFPAGTLLNGEIGILSEGEFVESGVFFASEQESFQLNESTIFYVKLSEAFAGVDAGQNVTFALTPLRLFGRNVDKTKVMRFNPYPLYLVCKMRDNALVNSVSIKETIGDTSVATSPKWIVNPKASIAPVINNNAVDDLAPVNFISQNRLDSASIDIQLEQNLRPGEIVDSFYVGSNETKVVDLTNIYGADRENITPDLFNTEATFFIARTIDASSGTIQISLNTAEQ